MAHYTPDETAKIVPQHIKMMRFTIDALEQAWQANNMESFYIAAVNLRWDDGQLLSIAKDERQRIKND